MFEYRNVFLIAATLSGMVGCAKPPLLAEGLAADSPPSFDQQFTSEPSALALVGIDLAVEPLWIEMIPVYPSVPYSDHTSGGMKRLENVCMAIEIFCLPALPWLLGETIKDLNNMAAVEMPSTDEVTRVQARTSSVVAETIQRSDLREERFRRRVHGAMTEAFTSQATRYLLETLPIYSYRPKSRQTHWVLHKDGRPVPSADFLSMKITLRAKLSSAWGSLSSEPDILLRYYANVRIALISRQPGAPEAQTARTVGKFAVEETVMRSSLSELTQGGYELAEKETRTGERALANQILLNLHKMRSSRPAAAPVQ